jgi:hypothetical protein
LNERRTDLPKFQLLGNSSFSPFFDPKFENELRLWVLDDRITDKGIASLIPYLSNQSKLAKLYLRGKTD